MAIIWALVAAFGYGTADYFAREAGRSEGALKTLFYLQLVGSLLVAALLLAAGPIPWPDILSVKGLHVILVSLVFTLASVLLYRALVIGPLLIVSPIAGSGAAVTVVLSLLVGERPGSLQLAGIVVTLAGVVLAARTAGGAPRQSQANLATPRRAWLTAGVTLATASALFFGLGTWLLRYVAPALGGLPTVLVLRLGSLAYVGAFLLVSRMPVGLTTLSSLKWLLPIGIFDTVANWALILGLMSGLTSIVAVIASLFSVVTILLGYFLAKERLSRVQQVGVGITLVGVALVSA